MDKMTHWRVEWISALGLFLGIPFLLTNPDLKRCAKAIQLPVWTVTVAINKNT